MIKFFSVLIFAGWTAHLGRMLIQFTPEATLPRLIANAHTFINVGMTLLVLPFTPQVAWLVDRMAGKAKPVENLLSGPFT